MMISEPFIGLFYFSLFLFSAFGYGNIITIIFSRILNNEILSKDESSLFFNPPLSFGFISFLYLIIGLLGLLHSWIAWFILISGLILLFFTRKKVSFNIKLWSQNQINIINIILFITIILNILYYFLNNALLPPTAWDEIAYHLAVPELYLKNHRIYYIPFIFQSNWPLLTQMLFMQGLLLGSDIFSHLITFFMGIWSIYGIVLLEKNIFHENKIWAASLFASIPIIYHLVGSGLIDIALVFWSVSTFLAFFKYLDDNRKVWLFLTGIFSGFTASVKITGIIIPISIVLILLILESKNKKKVSIFFNNILAISIPTIIIASPWYIRSYLYTNNPFFPFFFFIFGGNNWDNVGDLNNKILWGEMFRKNPINLYGLINTIKLIIISPEQLGSYPGLDIYLIVLFILGIILINISLTQNEDKKKECILLSFGGFYFLIWFLMQKHQVRFLYPIFFIISIISTNIIYLIENYFKKYANFFLFSISLIILLHNPWFDNARRHDVIEKAKISFYTTKRELYLYEKVNIVKAYNWIHEHTEAESKFLLLPFENRGYYLDRDYIWGHLGEQRIIKFDEFKNDKELMTRLQDLEIDYIIDSTTWIKESTPNWNHDRGIMLSLYENCSEKILEWDQQTLYKLSTCK
jgi:4-amino-4-deoxy-L-arabinose transferase-like glycosyltransferase